MVNKEIYLEVLDYVYKGSFMVNNAEIFSCNDMKEIGNIAITIILFKFDRISYEDLKKIICMRLNYDKKKYQEISYDDLCMIICKEIINFKSYPAVELLAVSTDYEKIQKKYNDLILKLNNEIEEITDLIRTDEECPNNCGTLIKKQKQIYSHNAVNKSLLKDLKKAEEEYISLDDKIQEKYVHQEMLKYAKKQIENYFIDTILNKSEEKINKGLKSMALELASEDTEMRSIKNCFIEYDRYLDAWYSITESMYKSFFIIKMRKFYDDIESFFNENYYASYWGKEEELVELCKNKSELIMDSNEWIRLMNSDKAQYLKKLKEDVSNFRVLEYLKNKTNSLYCMQKRRETLISLLEQFESKNYLIFVNLVIIQIEGIFYDLFFDVNIQKRLNGAFDMFENDDLKTKFIKNNSIGNIQEATYYFKFYFNNIIRNKIAHGRICYKPEELETTAFELLLDLQYSIHLISIKSDTNAAILYNEQTLKWLEFSFNKDQSGKNVNERLLSLLNANVINSSGNSISYSNPQQELYWIFNPYYIPAYTFSNIIDQNNKLRNYLTSLEFWPYVNQYLLNYNVNDDFHHIKIKHDFISRVKAIKEYVAKNKREVLLVLVDVENNLRKLDLKE